MDVWQSVLFAFGGNALLLLVLGWLARSLGSQFLAKDLARFKADLAAASSSTTEHLKHELQRAALEHQIRFSKLHERRAEVIAQLYGLLVEAHWASQSFISLAEFSGEPSKQEKYAEAMNRAADFYRFFDKNRIWLPEGLCRQLEQFLRNMRSKVVEFGVYVTHDTSEHPAHLRSRKWMSGSKRRSTSKRKSQELVPRLKMN